MEYGNPRQAVLHAYLAGLMDGEGSFRVNKIFTPNQQKKHKTINPTYHADIQCGMVEKAAVQLLLDTFGGSLREERVQGKRSVWRWRLNGRKQIPDAIDAMMPYLRVKKEHAIEVRKFCLEWVTPYSRKAGVDPAELQRREDAFQKMRKLNAVGAAATTERTNIRENEATV